MKSRGEKRADPSPAESSVPVTLSPGAQDRRRPHPVTQCLPWRGCAQPKVDPSPSFQKTLSAQHDGARALWPSLRRIKRVLEPALEPSGRAPAQLCGGTAQVARRWALASASLRLPLLVRQGSVYSG